MSHCLMPSEMIRQTIFISCLIHSGSNSAKYQFFRIRLASQIIYLHILLRAPEPVRFYRPVRDVRAVPERLALPLWFGFGACPADGGASIWSSPHLVTRVKCPRCTTLCNCHAVFLPNSHTFPHNPSISLHHPPSSFSKDGGKQP